MTSTRTLLVLSLLSGLMVAGGVPYGCGNGSNVDPQVSPQWRPLNSLTRGYTIYGLHGTSPNDMFAMGGGGSLLHYNGTSWSLIDAATSETFFRAYSPSPGTAYVVSSTHTIRKFDRGSWSTVYTDPDPGQHLACIFAFAPNDIHVGGVGYIYHYNGTSWTSTDIETVAYVFGIWGSSPDRVRAVTLDGEIFLYDGASWTREAVIHGATFQEIFGTSEDHIYAVSSTPGLELAHYNGTTWELVTDLPPSSGLFGVWGTAADTIYVVGNSGFIARYDGNDWEQVFDIPAVDYQGVWGTSEDNVMIVGEQGLLLRKNGESWTEELGDLRGHYYAIWGTGPDNIYFGGSKISRDSDATILHYNGATLTSIETDSTYTIRGLWGTSENDLFAATQKSSSGQLLHYDGSSWSIQHENDNLNFYDIWGASSSAVFAVGHTQYPPFSSLIMKYDGSTWTTLESFDNCWLDVVSGGSSTEVYFAGVYNPGGNGHKPPLLYRYNGTSIEAVALPAEERILGMHYLTGRGLYAGSSKGKLFFYDGSSWTTLANPSYANVGEINSVWAASENSIFIATSYGGINHYNGSTVSTMYPFGTPSRIWGIDPDNVYAVGRNGLIMRYGR